jgi:hypothetical protein
VSTRTADMTKSAEQNQATQHAPVNLLSDFSWRGDFVRYSKSTGYVTSNKMGKLPWKVSRWGFGRMWEWHLHSNWENYKNFSQNSLTDIWSGYLRNTYEDVSRSFRTGRLERELQMVQLSVTRCCCIVILWVSLVSFSSITLCVASQRVFTLVVVYFVIDSVRKLLNTPSYVVFYRYISLPDGFVTLECSFRSPMKPS